jgi:hypothetical protein
MAFVIAIGGGSRYTGVPESQRLKASLRVSVPLNSKFSNVFKPYRTGIHEDTMLFEHRFMASIALAVASPDESAMASMFMTHTLSIEKLNDLVVLVESALEELGDESILTDVI